MEMLSDALLQLSERLSAQSDELVGWTLTIVVFSILIFKFYRFVAKRDLFKTIEKRRKVSEPSHQTALSFWAGLVEYGIFFPVLVCLWFAGFALVLFFLARDFSVAQVSLFSVTLVTAIRVTAYYNEEVSITLAELMPYWLLGTVLVTADVFSVETATARLSTIYELIPDVITYFVFVVLVEWFLRVLLSLKHFIFGVSVPSKEED